MALTPERTQSFCNVNNVRQSVLKLENHWFKLDDYLGCLNNVILENHIKLSGILYEE